MHNYFNFSHTIKEEEDQSSDSYDKLFRIGGKAINSHKEEKKKIKKEKKQKKHKKEKKHKRIKSEEEEPDELIIQEQKLEQQLQMKPYEKSKYQIQPVKTTQDLLEQQFAVNQKVSENTLTFDILKFKNDNLFQYGLKDKEVPQFQRLRGQTMHYLRFQYVIGMKRNKKNKKIVRQANKVINQKPIKVKEDNYDRYFDFQGYDILNSVQIDRVKAIHDQPIIAFNENALRLPTNEEKLKQLSKEYSKSLNENPQDVGLWLKFIQIQDTVGMIVGEHQQRHFNQAVLQRKIAIVEKALKYNEQSEILAISYLNLLIQVEKDRGEIQKHILHFIGLSPQSSQLWIFYLEFKISNFVKFCHSRLQKDWQEIIHHLEVKIESVKSAMQIWRIRKASLAILKQVLRVYKLEGYEELVTAISTGLVEYNILSPQINEIESNDRIRIQRFKQYWEDYSQYHVGQIQNSSWRSNHSHKDPQTYIEKIALQFGQAQWMPSHTKHNQQRIQQDPQSFILFQDVEPYLRVYRSKENLEMILDIFLNNFQMPTIYGMIEPDAFLYKWIQYPRSIICSNFPLWSKYWNPIQSHQFVSNIAKFIYALRVCEQVKKVQKNDKKLNEYLLFLHGITVIYEPFHPFRDKEESFKAIQSILSEDPTNIRLWVIYIQIQSINGKSQKQCLECFYQCLSLIEETVEKLWVLFWLKHYLMDHSFKTDILLRLLCQILLQEKVKSMEQIVSLILCGEDVNINEMDRLLLSSKLKQLWSSVHKDNNHKSIVYYFLLELGYRSQEMVQQILNCKTEFAIHMLMDHQLLTLQHFQSKKILCQNYYSLRVIRYWLHLLPANLLLNMYPSFCKAFPENKHKLLTWFMIMNILKSQYLHVEGYFDEFFISKGKQMSLKTVTHEPQCAIILNKIIKDQNYAFNCLEKLPYCRDLYEILSILDPEKSEKIQSLALEKEIRKRNQY